MRIALTLLPAVLLAACGSDPATSSATGGATDTQTGGGPTTQDSPTTTGVSQGSATDTPTGGSITGGMTESGTTTASTDSETSTSTTSTTSATGTGTADTGSTSPVQTDTGTADTGETTTTTVGESSTTGEPGSTSTGGSSSGGGDDSTSGGAEEACPCPDIEVPLDDGIFVLASNASLWKFFPETNDLVLLGTPSCDLPPSTFSMAVDRLGFAWLQYSSGALRKVAVSDLNQCVNPGFVPNQQGVNNFGMAFVSNSASDKCDRIFGDQYTGDAESPKVADFFSIDPMTQQMMKLGKTDFGTAEVTGTGDGRAFLFAPSNPSKLVEVDRTNGATISSIPLPGVTAGGGWAFAFFGGDFYFFTDGQNDGQSEVTHIDYDDSDNNGKQDIKVVVNNAPLKIVGAGVSTCAPTLPQ